jgi:hypothetical protein
MTLISIQVERFTRVAARRFVPLSVFSDYRGLKTDFDFQTEFQTVLREKEKISTGSKNSP